MLSIIDLIEAMETPNNYRKMHGQKPMRWKHIWNARSERVRKEQMDINSLYPWGAFLELGESAKRAGASVAEFMETMKRYNHYVGLDLAEGEDFYTPSYVHSITGKEYYSAKPINQDAIVKIVAKEERADE